MGVPPLTLSRDSAHHTPYRQRFCMGGILRRIVSNRNSRGCCILSAQLYTKSRQKESALL